MDINLLTNSIETKRKFTKDELTRIANSTLFILTINELILSMQYFFFSNSYHYISNILSINPDWISWNIVLYVSAILWLTHKY